MFKKILLPTDASEVSIKAARYVLEIIKDKPGAKVTALTVDQIAHQFASYATIYSPEMESTINEMAQRRLEHTAEVFRAEGIEIDTVHLKGDPGLTITQYAVENGFDVIVMGTTGAGNIGGALFGSVALKVLGMAKVPVLLISKSCQG